MMRGYLKILSSIIAALLSWASLASVVAGVVEIVFGGSSFADAVIFSFAFVWAGFVMFGITGSVFWFGFLSVFGNRPLGPMLRQVLAASLSTLVSWLIMGWALSDGSVKGVLGSAVVLVLVVPVVAVSLLWYWYLYLRPKRSQVD